VTRVACGRTTGIDPTSINDAPDGTATGRTGDLP
jgi:hypothetical protein